MRSLLKEILDYGELKRRWGYGHIEIIRDNHICQSIFCDGSYRFSTFYGYYVNKRNEKRRLYLGFSFINVFCLLEGKKALLSDTLLGNLAVKTDQ